ncbi:hypothetical protein [Spiroplasma endosymbiont of Tipula paludosa]|uniref:hypothetical protein n=1 Tax=Spiroplasma endosymbiont of Tipula paludosa TaxID=3066295 RepID=UPI0035C90E8A
MKKNVSLIVIFFWLIQVLNIISACSLSVKDLSTLNSLQAIIYQSNNQYNKLQQEIIKEEQFIKRPLSTKAKFKYFADSEAPNDISSNLQVKGDIWVTISVGNDEKYGTGTSKPLLMSLISPFTEIANFGSPAQTIPTFSYSNGSFYVFLHNRILKGDQSGNFQELGTIPTSDTFWSALVYNDNIYMGTITKKLFKGNKNGNFQELTNWTGGMIWSLAVHNNNFYLGTDKGKVFLVKDSNTFEEIFSVPDSGAKIIRIGSFNNSLYVGVNYGISSSKLFKESTVGNFTELSNFDKNINDMIFVNNNIYIALQNGEVLKSDSTGNFNLFFNLLAGIRNLVFYAELYL